MEITPITPGSALIAQTHQPYSIHIADEAHPRRLGPLWVAGVTDEQGRVFVPNVECGDYVIALPGVEETRALLVLPFDDHSPQQWLAAP